MSPPSTSLSTVEDLDRRRELQAAASRVATRTADGKLGLVKRRDWIAVAAQEGMLSTEAWRRHVTTALHEEGTGVLNAVALDSVYDEPALEVPATERGLGELQTELGAWNFVVFPPGERWAIVSTSEDIAAFVGPEPVVAELIGRDSATARAELEEFLDDEEFWPAEALAYFRRLIAAIESYDDLPEGEIVELPINV